MATGDVSGDGLDDVVIGDTSSHFVVVTRQQWDGTFASSESYTVGGTPGALAVAQVNMYGAKDIVVLVPEQQGVIVLYSQYSGDDCGKGKGKGDCGGGGGDGKGKGKGRVGQHRGVPAAALAKIAAARQLPPKPSPSPSVKPASVKPSPSVGLRSAAAAPKRVGVAGDGKGSGGDGKGKGGDGTGTFEAAPNHNYSLAGVITGVPTAVVVGKINDDGFPDIVVSWCCLGAHGVVCPAGISIRLGICRLGLKPQEFPATHALSQLYQPTNQPNQATNQRRNHHHH